MRTSLPLMSVLLAAAACSPTEPGVGPVAEIRYGTSFNMCVGYCTSVLAVEGTTARLTHSSHDSGTYPRTVRWIRLTEEERARIDAVASIAALSAVAGVHGCPDCADGGAEWIAIATRAGTVQATYDYGIRLEPIAALQAELRALRQRFQQDG